MLGLSTGSVWDSGIKSLEEPPQTNLVGHWDFTDVTQLSGGLSGSFTGSYLSGTDPIGRCKNKAPVLSVGSKLGSWVRAISNDTRPTYVTGGANGNSYARFDNSSYTQALVCRSTDAANWGANGTDNLSSTRLFAENISIFIVGEPLDDDTDGTVENAFSYYGYYDNPSGFSSGAHVIFELERDDDDDVHAKFTIGGGTTSPNTVDATQADSHWSSGGVSIINLQTSVDIGGSYIYTNNTPDVGQNIYSPLSGDFAQNAWADLDPVNYDDSLTASIGIGGSVDSSGGILSDSFEGKIYEILVYSAGGPFVTPLSESDRAALTYYLGYKYNATISA
jgi:hypothetical protein